MSYDPVFRSYSKYISNLEIRACGENQLVQVIRNFGVNVLEESGCEVPTVEVFKEGRRYLKFFGSIDADTTWAVLNLLVRVSNGLVHLGSQELGVAKQLDSTIRLYIDVGCVKCLELIDLLGQVVIANERTELEVLDMRSVPKEAEKDKVVEAPKIVYKGRKVDGNMPSAAILRTLLKIQQGAL